MASLHEIFPELENDPLDDSDLFRISIDTQVNNTNQ